MSKKTIPIPANDHDMSMLVVDDDDVLRLTLRKAMEKRGFEVSDASSIAEGLELTRRNAFAFAVVDMRLGDGNGLEIVEALRGQREDTRIVMLSGYGNVACAVTAVRKGAVDFLAKPADADQIASILLSPEYVVGPPPKQPMSVERVREEHIKGFFEEFGGNVSETARRLKMHRRTLQRLLSKYAS